MHHHEEEKHACPAAPVVLNQDSECAVYGYADSPGTLRLTAYPVFPGIKLIYNDIHADLQMRPHDAGPDLLEINHCHEGHMEVQNGAESFFLAPGDLSVSRPDVDETLVRFPTGHYHGITVRIDSKRSPDCLTIWSQARLFWSGRGSDFFLYSIVKCLTSPSLAGLRRTLPLLILRRKSAQVRR